MLCTEKPDSLVSLLFKYIYEGQNSLQPLAHAMQSGGEGNSSTCPAGAQTRPMRRINMSCDWADCWLLLFHDAPRCCVFSLSLSLYTSTHCRQDSAG